MQVRYRYVPYGTNFESRAGARPGGEKNSSALYENEIAADIGGIYWESGVATPPGRIAVIDHHFSRDGQFPSASAAVVHSASDVHQWWHEAVHFGEVWLVTHENPDFDAFASLYLIRSFRHWQSLDTIALGIARDGWRDLTVSEAPPSGTRRIDWFRGPDATLDAEARWRLFLAVVASMSDNCRRFGCPRTHAAPSVLYAALQRGRPFLQDGATPFFDYFREAVALRHRNPIFDAIFEADSEFAPEVELLGRDLEAYDRDIRRSRRAIVAIPSYQERFEDYYAKVCTLPLLTESGRLSRGHETADGVPLVADGIYIRDPESLLFKDLARADGENSSLQKGFLFTAVAYSNGRSGATRNQTDYYFALDPERTEAQTLLPLWAHLEQGELASFSEAERDELHDLSPRRGFEGRAAEFGGLLHDPWFDGSNYRATLIATPHRGTLIAPSGRAVDLSDDPVAKIVREQLEYAIYAESVRIVDFSGDAAPSESYHKMGEAVAGTTSRAGFRFCTVPLVLNLDLNFPLQCQQIGEQLWQALHPGANGTPDDFRDRHLIREQDAIAVWSRRGIAIAYQDGSSPRARTIEVEGQFRKVAALLAQAVGFGPGNAAATLRGAESLLRDISRFRHELAMAGSSLAMRRFVEAVGFHDTLGAVRDLLVSQRGHRLASATRTSIRELRAGQRKLELLEVLFVTLYSIELVHILLEQLSKAPEGLIEVRILCVLGLVLGVAVAWGMSAGDGKARSVRRRLLDPIMIVPAVTIVVLLMALSMTFQPMLGWYRDLIGLR